MKENVKEKEEEKWSWPVGALCAASGAEEDSRFSWRNVIGGAGTA